MITMTDGNGTTYGLYDTRETTVNWRRYSLQSGTTDTTLTARVRLACIPLVNDYDQSDIGNIPALEEAIRALTWFDNGDYPKADEAMRHAIWYMNGEYARYEVETEIGTAQLDYSAGAGSICNIL